MDYARWIVLFAGLTLVGFWATLNFHSEKAEPTQGTMLIRALIFAAGGCLVVLGVSHV